MNNNSHFDAWHWKLLTKDVLFNFFVMPFRSERADGCHDEKDGVSHCGQCVLHPQHSVHPSEGPAGALHSQQHQNPTQLCWTEGIEQIRIYCCVM